MSYGIYDTKDYLWIGDEKTPNSYDELVIARIASQVLEDMVTGTDLGGRFVAKELPQSAIWNHRDNLSVKRTAVQSLRRIEGVGRPGERRESEDEYGKIVMEWRKVSTPLEQVENKMDGKPDEYDWHVLTEEELENETKRRTKG